MQEIKNEVYEVKVGESSLAITKGYAYINKDGKNRYTYNDFYYVDGERVCRKHSNEKGDFYYNIQLVDVVIESFLMKDGKPGSKTYLLSEVPYLAPDADHVDLEVLKHYLEFKLHR